MTNQEYAAALREIADLYERDERMLQPNNFEIFVGCAAAEAVRGMIKALATSGRVDKLPPKTREDYWYRLQRLFAGVQVQFLFTRDSVCKRVTKMELVEAWECPDSILEAE